MSAASRVRATRRSIGFVLVALAAALAVTSVAEQTASTSLQRRGSSNVGRHHARALVAVAAPGSPVQDAIQAAKPHHRTPASTRRVATERSELTTVSQPVQLIALRVAWHVREAAASTTRLRAPPLSFHS